ncbi:MAG: cysteine hydrolase [Nitrososphaera sp.]|jgi:nicotinamidase-related amidase
MAKKTRSESDTNKEARYAILVVDMLNDFVHGKMKCERAKKIVPNLRLLLDTARKNRIPIFYCNDEHLPTDTYEMRLWGPHAMKGTEGAKVIDELRPHDSDYVIPKRTYSAFDGTGLDKALKRVYGGMGANTIIITGIHTNICDRHTAYDAFVRGLDIIVPEDGVDALTEEDHISGLDYMKRMYGTKIKKISDVMNAISS